MLNVTSALNILCMMWYIRLATTGNGRANLCRPAMGWTSVNTAALQWDGRQ